jgi:hypothetical protein
VVDPGGFAEGGDDVDGVRVVGAFEEEGGIVVGDLDGVEEY